MVKKSVKGKNGGTLYPQQAGEPGHSPNLGRNKNPFRQHIQELAETAQTIILKGRLIGDDGSPTGKLVRVAVLLPGAYGIVVKAMKAAAKNDAQARKWLSETGYGKMLDPESFASMPSNFTFIVEDRRKENEQSD